MKKRNPLVIVILSIITFGIYDIYWLYVTKEELNAKTKQHVPSIWLLFSPIILIIAGVILLILGSANAHTVTSTPIYSNGFTTTTTSTVGVNGGEYFAGVGLVVLSCIVFTIISMIWFYKFSKAVNEYTSGKMTTAVTFLILWLIHWVGIALVQDAFNDMDGPVLASTQGPTAAPMPPLSTTGQDPVNQSFQQTAPVAMPNYQAASGPVQPIPPASPGPLTPANPGQPSTSASQQSAPTYPLNGNNESVSANQPVGPDVSPPASPGPTIG